MSREEWKASVSSAIEYVEACQNLPEANSAG
jgi:hypothetical protein